MKQPDLICTQCPLSECSEESLFCMYRFITRPNKAQEPFILQVVKQKKKVKRRAYFRKRYLDQKRVARLATTTSDSISHD